MIFRLTLRVNLLLILCLSFVFSVNGTAQSICADPNFASLRPCVGRCIGCNYPAGYQVQSAIGCDANPPNECWCRTDMYTIATSYFQSCASVLCTIGGWQPDYTSVVSFYGNYCRRAGFTAVTDGPSNAIATPTVDANAPTITKITYVTQTSIPNSGTSNVGGEWLFPKIPRLLLATIVLGIATWYAG
jgi:hypothetical protein